MIKRLDEVPPELMTPESREYLADIMGDTKQDAAAVMRAAVQMGMLYSEVNRGKNLAAGFDEDDFMELPEPGRKADPESKE